MAERQFVTFKLGEDYFGIDILVVREINRNIELTLIDKVPDYVRGLLNLRGQIVTVLDLGRRLGLERRDADKTSSYIVLKTNQELERNGVDESFLEATSSDVVGLFVDEIGDVVTVDSNAIDPPALHKSGIAKRFIEGVVKLEGRLLITLNISTILAAEDEFAVLSAN